MLDYETAQLSPKPTASPDPTSGRPPAPCRRRISPWRKFTGSIIPNWLLRRSEVSQGAKLAYGRLAQYAGQKGRCFPKQRTLAAELGVGERSARAYIGQLTKFGLIERDRLGLRKPNHYFFLDHPWIHQGQPERVPHSSPEQQLTAVPERQDHSGPDRQETSAPTSEENQENRFKDNTHTVSDLLHSLEEAMEVARQLGIDEQFARQEFHAKKAVGWRDGYGNLITSWPDHLQARWTIEQRKRSERQSTGRTSAGRPPVPPRQFNGASYRQPVEDF